MPTVLPGRVRWPGSTRTSASWAMIVVWIVLAAVPGATARADEGAKRSASSLLTEGFYIVRTGDTLESLAQRFLGDSQRWREIWRLNSDVENPHFVRPGQRLRILVDRLPDDAALVAETSNRVENQMVPLPWADATRGDVLRWRDSLRTFVASSASLRFSDESELLVSEESLLFLDPTGPRRERNEPAAASEEADRIEIVVGQADLVAKPSGQAPEASTLGIELVLGDTVLKPQPADDGALETRARRPEGGGAKLMVYSGEGAVEAAGATVELSQGTGSAVDEGEPPGPPEKLLDAPGLDTPAAGARLATPRPRFAWSAIDSAAGYVIEVCRDPSCAQLVARTTDLTDTTWRPSTALPVAELHWRVTARSASGLDGYPTPARALSVTAATEDTTAPVGRVVARGRLLPPRSGLNERWILAPDAELVAEVDDSEADASGVASWALELDGEPVDGAGIDGETAIVPPPGPHDATLRAIDAAENESTSEPLRILVDDQPPTLRWGVESASSAPFEIALSDDGDVPTAVTLPGRSEISTQGGLPWQRRIWRIERDPRQIVLRPGKALRIRVTGHDAPGAEPVEVDLGPEQGLWVLAEDAGTLEISVFDHAIEVERERLTLHVVTEDGVGNRRTDRLTLEAVRP